MDEHATLSCAEQLGSRFEPDVMLPTQFFGAQRGTAAVAGEHRLIVAVLDDAISCFQKNRLARDIRGQRLFRQTEAWFMSADRELPFAFENICDFLGLNPDYIRIGVRRWARRPVSDSAPLR